MLTLLKLCLDITLFARITFKPLRSEDTHYMALGMNYSTAGFELILSRKMSFYIITYYLPSGLFVGISWVRYDQIKLFVIILEAIVFIVF